MTDLFFDLILFLVRSLFCRYEKNSSLLIKTLHARVEVEEEKSLLFSPKVRSLHLRFLHRR